MDYATGFGKRPFPWPERSCHGAEVYPPDIYVRFAKGQIAYIQEISIMPSNLRAKIGHFAPEAGVEGKGIGTALAKAFFTEIHDRYGIETLIFSERSTQYEQKYPPFFARLGARPVDVPRQRIPDWHWDYSDLQVASLAYQDGLT